MRCDLFARVSWGRGVEQPLPCASPYPVLRGWSDKHEGGRGQLNRTQDIYCKRRLRYVFATYVVKRVLLVCRDKKNRHV